MELITIERKGKKKIKKNEERTENLNIIKC